MSIEWEYKKVENDGSVDDLNTLGRYGWELCAMFERKRNCFMTLDYSTTFTPVKIIPYFECILKRQKNDKLE